MESEMNTIVCFAVYGVLNYHFIPEIIFRRDGEDCCSACIRRRQQRVKTDSEVDAAILNSQCHEKDPKLPSLMKMLMKAQNQLDQASYPRLNDILIYVLQHSPILLFDTIATSFVIMLAHASTCVISILSK
ncbi:uncharacterized protein LOC121744426 [Salvia splendens]|uniref:uncharacterized protein LOC121744426 n=1 Tax=Salvia splendens TaxID=180675 RepID=UPI001C252EED|nr:uncharacterized protein LOC121744426 [Salvia splendens]